MSISGPILVCLANGVQGSAVVRAARRRGHSVRALVRSIRDGGGPNDPGVEAARADLDQPDSLASACAGIAHVVLQVPTGAQADMVRRAQAVVAAARNAGVRSIILRLASASRPVSCGEPSFVANAALEEIVRAAGIPFAIVRPTMYLDNLLKPSARADIAERGVFEPPIAANQRIAWTSADDCAEATVLLLERGAYGGDHRIAGAESVTGDQLAARLSAGFGRAITYRAQPITAFEKEVDEAMGLGMGLRIASKFRYFRDHPDDADRILSAPYEPTPPLAGFAPTPIAEWAQQHAGDFFPSRTQLADG